MREFGREKDFRDCERCRNEREVEVFVGRKMEAGELERK